jgi:DinB superfamily
MISFTPGASRLELLLRQLDTSYEALAARLAGLTDEEYFWEPVPGCVTLVEAGGRWQPARGHPASDPPPFTTLGRRLGHLAVECILGRWDYTFGSRTLTIEDVDYGGSAAEGLALLSDAYTKWRTGLGTLSDGDLDTVGLSSMPWGLDPGMPFADILWWNNRELIHHGAELAMLRDLWAHSTGGKSWT